MGCSSTQGAPASDAQGTCDAASCDAAVENRMDLTGVEIACGPVTCTASDGYCEVHTGGAGGAGGGQSAGIYMTYRCVPFPSSCSSHSCACSLGCDQCTQDGAGAVTVMCRSV